MGMRVMVGGVPNEVSRWARGRLLWEGSQEEWGFTVQERVEIRYPALHVLYRHCEQKSSQSSDGNHLTCGWFCYK